MIRRYCDLCGAEMTDANTPRWGTSHGRLEAALKRKGETVLKVEVIQSVNGTSNAGDVCKYCILDALYRLDDRPKEAQRVESNRT